MVKAKALKPIYNSGVIVGYTLKDETGSEMNIKSEAIMDAMNKNLISIVNLKITNDNKLVMVGEIKRDEAKTEPKQLEKSIEPVKPKVIEEYTGDSNNKVARMHYLVKTLNIAREVYEQGTDEIMSNYEYDKLYDELELLEKDLGTVLSNSPTINVGYEVLSGKLPKEKHEVPMLSLGKTKDRAALKSFLQGKEGVLSWKLDGLTVVVTYDKGRFVKAVTRGNGEIGEIVTPNAKQFKNLPMQIPFLGKLVLRGEAVISYSSFEKINNQITIEEDKYKNPRNLCSGSVRQLDSSVTAQRDVYWYCFEVVDAGEASIPNDFDKQLLWSKNLGFEVVENYVVNNNNFTDIISKFEQKITSGYDLPSDGLVLTFRDRAYGNSLGCTAKSPRHSMAFKWADTVETTEIIDIEWSPSRNGLITPVAIFKPVDIEGSTVSRASVHNVSIFADLELGYGDRIRVFKANMIIPQILENLDKTSTCEIPSECPCCGFETEIYEEPKSGVYTLWCRNPECETKGNRLFEHFVSRDAMNIDGISKATIVKFIEEGILTDLASIFKIKEHREDIIYMDGFGVKSFNNMVNAIEKARNVKLANLLYALGIPNVGLSTAKLICKNFGNDMKKTVCATYGQLCNINGIGEVIASSFTSYFQNKENAEQFIRILEEIDLIEEEVVEGTGMEGVTICVTGDVYIFPNRRAIKDKVESMGGKLTGSVSKSTHYLVTNDTTSGSNKNKKAQEYGIPILTEQEFIDKFNIQV